MSKQSNKSAKKVKTGSSEDHLGTIDDEERFEVFVSSTVPDPETRVRKKPSRYMPEVEKAVKPATRVHKPVRNAEDVPAVPDIEEESKNYRFEGDEEPENSVAHARSKKPTLERNSMSEESMSDDEEEDEADSQDSDSSYRRGLVEEDVCLGVGGWNSDSEEEGGHAAEAQHQSSKEKNSNPLSDDANLFRNVIGLDKALQQPPVGSKRNTDQSPPSGGSTGKEPVRDSVSSKRNTDRGPSSGGSKGKEPLRDPPPKRNPDLSPPSGESKGKEPVQDPPVNRNTDPSPPSGGSMGKEPVQDLARKSARPQRKKGKPSDKEERQPTKLTRTQLHNWVAKEEYPNKGKIKHVKGDGACFFRALAFLLYGDECHHVVIRQACEIFISFFPYLFTHHANLGEIGVSDIYEYAERLALDKGEYADQVEHLAVYFLWGHSVKVCTIIDGEVKVQERYHEDSDPFVLILQDEHYYAVYKEPMEGSSVNRLALPAGMLPGMYESQVLHEYRAISAITTKQHYLDLSEPPFRPYPQVLNDILASFPTTQVNLLPRVFNRESLKSAVAESDPLKSVLQLWREWPGITEVDFRAVKQQVLRSSTDLYLRKSADLPDATYIDSNWIRYLLLAIANEWKGILELNLSPIIVPSSSSAENRATSSLSSSIKAPITAPLLTGIAPVPPTRTNIQPPTAPPTVPPIAPPTGAIMASVPVGWPPMSLGVTQSTPLLSAWDRANSLQPPTLYTNVAAMGLFAAANSTSQQPVPRPKFDSNGHLVIEAAAKNTVPLKAPPLRPANVPFGQAWQDTNQVGYSGAGDNGAANDERDNVDPLAPSIAEDFLELKRRQTVAIENDSALKNYTASLTMASSEATNPYGVHALVRRFIMTHFLGGGQCFTMMFPMRDCLNALLLETEYPARFVTKYEFRVPLTIEMMHACMVVNFKSMTLDWFAETDQSPALWSINPLAQWTKTYKPKLLVRKPIASTDPLFKNSWPTIKSMMERCVKFLQMWYGDAIVGHFELLIAQLNVLMNGTIPFNLKEAVEIFHLSLDGLTQTAHALLERLYHRLSMTSDDGVLIANAKNIFATLNPAVVSHIVSPNNPESKISHYLQNRQNKMEYRIYRPPDDEDESELAQTKKPVKDKTKKKAEAALRAAGKQDAESPPPLPKHVEPKAKNPRHTHPPSLTICKECHQYFEDMKINHCINPKITVGNQGVCYKNITHGGCPNENCNLKHDLTNEQLAKIVSLNSPGWNCIVARKWGYRHLPKLTAEQAVKMVRENKMAFLKLGPSTEIPTYSVGAASSVPFNATPRVSLFNSDTPESIAAARTSFKSRNSSPLEIPPDWSHSSHASSESLLEISGQSWLSKRVPGLSLAASEITNRFDKPFPQMEPSVVDPVESPLAIQTREVAAVLKTVFPDMEEQLGPLWYSHVLNLSALVTIQLGQDHPVWEPYEWIQLAVESLTISIAAESKRHALIILRGYLNPKIDSSLRAGATPRVPNVVQCGRVKGITQWRINGFTVVTKDIGEEMDGHKKQCFHLNLSTMLGVSPVGYRETMSADIEQYLDVLGPPQRYQSIFEVQIRRFAHDFRCEQDQPQDCNLFRFFNMGGLFKTVRLIILSLTENTAVLHIMNSPDFTLDNWSINRVMVIANGHAEQVRKMPEQFGGDFGEDGKPITNQQVKALSKWIDDIGGEVIHSQQVTQEEVLAQAKTIDSYSLQSCKFCKEKCIIDLLTSGGAQRPEKVSSFIQDFPQEPTWFDPTLIKPPPTIFKAPLNTTGTKVAFLKEDQGYPDKEQKIHLCRLPAVYLHWAACTKIAHGFTPANIKLMFKERSAASQEWSQMSVEKLKLHPFDPGILHVATTLLVKIRHDLPLIDRKLVQSGDEPEWVKLQALFQHLIDKSDELLLALKDVRAAMAVYRRAKLDIDGSLPLDEHRIDSLQGLIPDVFTDVLKSIASMGVPLLLLKDKPLPRQQVESHKSASLAIKEIVFNALVDAAGGGVLVFSGRVQAELDESGVINAPLGAVDKKLANGDISKKKRLIFDLRDLNEEILRQAPEQLATTGLDTSEACTPSVLKMLRHITLLWYCFPFCKLVIFKRDFINAFKLLHYNLAEVNRIAAAIPFFSAIMISSVLVFGQTKSPAWFSIFAMAVIAAFTMVSCPNPAFNGPLPVHADIHVDDTLAVFRQMADNHKYFSALFHFFSEVYLGKASVSDDKLNEEGELTDYIQAWGYIWDLRRLQWLGPSHAFISIPSAKVEKMRNLLKEITVLDLVQRKVTLDYHQRLQGLAVYMSLCSKPLYSALQRLFPMTSSTDEVWLRPWEEADQKWDDYAEGIAMMKLLCNDGSYFEASCTSSILQILSPREQIDMGVPVVFLGSDATGAGTREGVLSAINYKDKVWTANVITPFMDALEGHVDFTDVEVIVAIAEFIPIVLMAMESGHRWSGHLVVSACDNQVVVAVLTNRRSSNRVLQFFMDIVVRLELRYRFQLTSVYINTKDNILADEISRIYHDVPFETLQEKVDEMHPGLTYVEMNTLLVFMTSSVSNNLFSRILPGEEDNIEAHAFAADYKRMKTSASTVTQDQAPQMLGTIIEVNSGLAPMSLAGKSRGFICSALVDRSLPSFGVANQLLESHSEDDPWLFDTPSKLFTVSRSGHSYSETSAHVHHGTSTLDHCTVLTFNPCYGAKNNQLIAPKQVLLLIKQLQPWVVVWVKHTTSELTAAEVSADWDDVMSSAGFVRVLPFGSLDQMEGTEVVSLTDIGSTQHAQRTLFTYERAEMAAALGSSAPLFKHSSNSNKMINHLDEIVDESLIIAGTFHPFNRVDTSSSCIQAGHVLIGSDHGELIIGQSVSFHGDRRWWILVCFEDADTLRVSIDGRRVDSQVIPRTAVSRQKSHRMPVLSIQGCSNAMLAWNDRPGGIGNKLIYDDRVPSSPVVRSLSSSEVMRMSGWNTNHVNMINSSTSGWSSSDKDFLIGSSTPLCLADALMGRIATRVATWYRRGGPGTPAETIVGGVEKRKPRVLPFENYLKTRHIDETVAYLKSQSIGKGTKFTYEASLRPWVEFRAQHNKSPLCTGSVNEEEHELCRFAATRTYIDRVKLSTIMVSLYAIRRFHVTKGLPSPLASRVQLNMLLDGIRRIEGPTQRKVPISMTLIRSMASRINPRVWDELVMITAAMVMYIFLLRSGEALDTGPKQDKEKVLRVGMVVFRRDGQEVTGPAIESADEVLLCIGKTKADQVGQGRVINANAVPGDTLCPVALLKRMYRMKPDHFNRSHRTFLFTLQNGTLLHRSKLIVLIRKEAVRAGYPPFALSIISFRSGGASAMAAAGCTPEQIKARGRWNSDCWKRYVWTGQDLTLMLTNAMLSSTFTPTTALHYFTKFNDDVEENL